MDSRINLSSSSDERSDLRKLCRDESGKFCDELLLNRNLQNNQTSAAENKDYKGMSTFELPTVSLL